MADFRFLALVVGGVNVAEINGHTVDAKTNGERMIGAGVVLGVSVGVPTFDIKATSVVPISGHSVDLMALLNVNAEVSVGFFYNGKAYVAPFQITEGSVKSEAAKGTIMGDWTFMNAGPAVAI